MCGWRNPVLADSIPSPAGEGFLQQGQGIIDSRTPSPAGVPDAVFRVG
ncbi:MAG: hypothetical protein JWN02_2629, partial [Acidobacteria bacterium]|nr:hypothetical protein [Acidobacteriota bacterium]